MNARNFELKWAIITLSSFILNLPIAMALAALVSNRLLVLVISTALGLIVGLAIGKGIVRDMKRFSR